MPPPAPEVSKWSNRRPRGPVGQRVTFTYTPTSMQQKRSFSPDRFTPANKCLRPAEHTSQSHGIIKMMHSYSSADSVASTSVDSISTASEWNDNTAPNITSPTGEFCSASTPVMGGNLHLLAELSTHVSPTPFEDYPDKEMSAGMQRDSSLTDSAPETCEQDTDLHDSDHPTTAGAGTSGS